MAITVKHMTSGQLGLHALSSEELHLAITILQDHGYEITDIDDDASEPYHAAHIHYTGGPQVIRTIQQLIGAPGAYRNKR